MFNALKAGIKNIKAVSTAFGFPEKLNNKLRRSVGHRFTYSSGNSSGASFTNSFLQLVSYSCLSLIPIAQTRERTNDA
jgi:hypothetical protein